MTDASLPWDVIVVGAGTAGLMAAEQAAVNGKRVLLLEKNRRPGVKILMSGGTRCNLTHNTDKWGIIKAYRSQGQFLHSALALLPPADLVRLVENEGVATKVEDTGKVFPVSNRATDILAAFTARLDRSGATLKTEVTVQSIQHNEGLFELTTDQGLFQSEKLILTTGGMSYPGSGTTGDGYAWAQAFGHTLVPPRPALVPITTSAEWVKELSGLTLPDVTLVVRSRIKPEPVASTTGEEGEVATAAPRKGKGKGKGSASDAIRRGSLLMTHFGLSGPVALDVSRDVTAVDDPHTLDIVCDFLPEVKQEFLDQQLQADFMQEGRRQVTAHLLRWVPRRLADQLVVNLGISPELKGAEVSRELRGRIVQALKACVLPVTGTRGFAKAEVTAGGVPLEEVDSRTMESKKFPGLYFAGEILDLDGPIGGFNFQAAFSTGMLAGQSA